MPLLTLTAAPAQDMWARRLVTVSNPTAQPVAQLVSLPLADLRLPTGTRLESLRLIEAARQRRVEFDLDAETKHLHWFVQTPAAGNRRYEVYGSADPDLLPVSPDGLPAPTVVVGRRDAGNVSHELAYRGPGPAITLVWQDNTPYNPDVTQTHPLPLTEADDKWMAELWRRRIGVASLKVMGQELVAPHWPGFWQALSYYYNTRPYSLGRLDEVRLVHGSLTSSLTASGAAENYAYGWGHGLKIRLRVQAMPVSRLRVEWTLTAENDLATVPETGRPARPQGQVSLTGLNFLPQYILPVFDRALWHDEHGRLQHAEVGIGEDRTFLDARPGGPGWCALFSTQTGVLLGLIPDQWGDGGVVRLAAYDDRDWPRNVLQMLVVGAPATNWKASQSHTWSYWLIGAQAHTQAEAVAAMSAAAASAGQGLRIEVRDR